MKRWGCAVRDRWLLATHGVIEQVADCFERGTASASALSTLGRCGVYWQISDTPEDEHADTHVRAQP